MASDLLLRIVWRMGIERPLRPIRCRRDRAFPALVAHAVPGYRGHADEAEIGLPELGHRIIARRWTGLIGECRIDERDQLVQVEPGDEGQSADAIPVQAEAKTPLSGRLTVDGLTAVRQRRREGRRG